MSEDHEKLRQWYLVNGFTEAAKVVPTLNLYAVRTTLARCMAERWLGFIYFGNNRLPALGPLHLGVPFSLLPFRLPPQLTGRQPRKSQVTASK